MELLIPILLGLGLLAAVFSGGSDDVADDDRPADPEPPIEPEPPV